MNIVIKNYKELEEKYPSVNIDSLVDKSLNYYTKNPFNENIKEIWLDKLKDVVILEKILDNNELNEESKEKQDEEDFKIIDIQKEKNLKSFEQVRQEFIELISGKDKKWGKATELLNDYLKNILTIYTTKNDLKNEIWIYKNGIYTPNGKSEIKEILRLILKDFYSAYTFNKVLEKIEPDTYIEESKFFSNNYVYEVPVENGILNILTGELQPFTPSKIFFNRLPVHYNPNLKCEMIEQFLKEILSKEDDIKIFYELVGYCLLKEMKFEKAFMFVGNGRNGKDKSLELIKRLIGVENCCSVPLSSLSPDSFIISEFFGKMVNIAGDINNQDLKDTSTFKALTGRSLVSAPRKFLNPITFVNHSKFIFACNDLPMVYDTSKGFWDRWVLLEFPYTFVQKEELNQNSNNPLYKLRDEDIIEKITKKEELSGLLNKSLESLRRILEKRDFSTTLGSQEIKEMWIRKSNSVMAFCLECIEENYEGFISKKQFRKKYSDFCKNHQIISKSDFVIKRTLEEMFGASEGRKNVDLGEFERVWEGIKWKN